MPFDAKAGVMLVAALFVVGILGATLLPIAINTMSGQQTATYNQSVGETVEVHAAGVNATVDSVTAGTSATYNVTYDGDSVTTTVNVSANKTVTVSGVDVEIHPTEVGNNYAVTEYSYPTDIGWGTGSVIWDNLPVIIVLTILLMVLGYGMRFV